MDISEEEGKTGCRSAVAARLRRTVLILVYINIGAIIEILESRTLSRFTCYSHEDVHLACCSSVKRASLVGCQQFGGCWPLGAR